jgi:hypothetical protein
MPLLVRSPLETSASDNLSLTHAIINPDRNEEIILRDLQACSWQITGHGFGDEEYIKALKMIEKDVKKRRHQTHAIAGDLHGYHGRPTLVQIWESEAERMLQQSAYEAKDPEIEKYVSVFPPSPRQRRRQLFF